MTNEEAIEILKDFEELNPCVPEDKEAVNKAIKALELVDKLDTEDGFTYRVVYQMGYDEGIRKKKKK